MGEVRLELPPVLEYQAKALWCPERYAVVEGSTKCGKTFPCLVWLLQQALAAGGANQHVWWVAPIYPQAEIAFTRMVSMLTQADPQQTIWSHNKSKMTVTIKGTTGRTIWFKSADNPDGLYGEDVYAAVIDEASRCPSESWHAVRSTLTATGGHVRIIGNVKGRKNWAYQMARKAEAGEKNMHYAKITAADAVAAGLIPQEEVEDARRQLPEQVFRELYLAEPSDDGSNPFGIQHIANAVRPMSSRPSVAWGVDLAKTHDWTVVVGLDDEGVPCYFDRWHGVSWDATEERIAAVVRDGAGCIDSSGVGDPIAERLARKCHNLEAYPTGARKQQLIEGLIVDIQQGRVKVIEGVMRSELESYEYQLSKTGRVQYSAPSGQHDDAVVALALAAIKLDRVANTQPPSISLVRMNVAKATLRPTLGVPRTISRVDSEW